MRGGEDIEVGRKEAWVKASNSFAEMVHEVRNSSQNYEPQINLPIGAAKGTENMAPINIHNSKVSLSAEKSMPISDRYGSPNVNRNSITFPDIVFDDDEDEDEIEVPKESYISLVLSEKTTKVVIILVLVLLFILPLFSSDTYKSVMTP